jgi:hypothetical protein
MFLFMTSPRCVARMPCVNVFCFRSTPELALPS